MNKDLESLTLEEINERLQKLMKQLDENYNYQKQLVDRYEVLVLKLEKQAEKGKKLYQEYQELMKENEQNK